VEGEEGVVVSAILILIRCVSPILNAQTRWIHNASTMIVPRNNKNVTRMPTPLEINVQQTRTLQRKSARPDARVRVSLLQRFIRCA
jgi:hypothetical protein